VINTDGQLLYIEIAGVLKEYKQWYYENKVIPHRSKEKYRRDLSAKESLLQNAGVNYFILFPCDISLDFLHDILFSDYALTFDKIRKFNKNNLDFKTAEKTGGLIFDRNKIGRDGQATQIII
jgi:hypothetical protein